MHTYSGPTVRHPPQGINPKSLYRIRQAAETWWPSVFQPARLSVPRQMARALAARHYKVLHWPICQRMTARGARCTTYPWGRLEGVPLGPAARRTAATRAPRCLASISAAQATVSLSNPLLLDRPPNYSLRATWRSRKYRIMPDRDTQNLSIPLLGAGRIVNIK